MDTKRNLQKKEARRAQLLTMLSVALVAAGATVGAVFLFRDMATDGELFRRILYGIVGVVVSLVALFAWFVLAAAIMAGRERGNFFLYDRKTKTSITPEQLDIARVRERLDYCFHVYLNARRQNAIPAQMRTLLLPYLLYAIMCGESDADWDRLLSSEKIFVDEMCASLAEIGADELGRTVQHHHALYRGKSKEGKRAIMAQKPLLEERLVSYIREHIEEYDA